MDIARVVAVLSAVSNVRLLLLHSEVVAESLRLCLPGNDRILLPASTAQTARGGHEVPFEVAQSGKRRFLYRVLHLRFSFLLQVLWAS